MNTRILKLKSELERNKERIASLKEKNDKLSDKITQLENAEIIATFRASGMTIEELISFFGKPEEKTISKPETEENNDEIKD